MYDIYTRGMKSSSLQIKILFCSKCIFVSCSERICTAYSLYENTVSNIGDVSGEIDITKGHYDTGNC